MVGGKGPAHPPQLLYVVAMIEQQVSRAGFRCPGPRPTGTAEDPPSRGIPPLGGGDLAGIF